MDRRSWVVGRTRKNSVWDLWILVAASEIKLVWSQHEQFGTGSLVYFLERFFPLSFEYLRSAGLDGSGEDPNRYDGNL